MSFWTGRKWPDAVENRFGVSGEGDSRQVLERIADKRRILGPGGVPDTARGADALIDDFRSGKLGRISLEFAREEGPGQDEK